MKNKLLGIVSVLFLFSLKSFAQNTSPNAVDDTVAICGNTGTINIVVQANDNDAEGNVLTTSIYTAPQNGMATLSGNTINYTPDQNFSGNDTLQYIICDNGTPSLCDTAMVIITVHPVPVADAGTSATICRFDSIMIGTPGAPGVSYQWAPSAGLNATNIAQPTASPASTTSYILTATDPIYGCSSSDTTTITINPVPVADAGTGSTSCQGDSVLLGTPGVAGNTYYWTPIPPLNWNNIPQPEAAPSTTTTFTLIVTITATGCHSMDTVTITINPRPNANAGPNLFVCNGDSVQLGSPALPGFTYSWSPATGLSATNVAQPMAGPSTTTTYTLVVTNATTGCHDTATATVTIGTGSFANAGPDVSSCNGDSVQIGATMVLGYSYFWSPATGLSATNVAQPMAAPATTTTYTMIVSNSFGCNDTDEVVVTVGSSPIANAGPDQQICTGQSVQIGTPGNPANGYSWSPANGLDSAIVAQPNASPTATTSYVLTVTQASSGCTATDTVLVTVNPLPTANAGADQTSCNGDSVLIGTPAVAGTTYSWSPAIGLSATNVAQPMADPLVNTTYTLTITNANGCSNTDSVNVNVGTVPPANAGPDQTICSGDSVQIGTLGIPGNVYSWSPSAGLDSANTAQPMAGPGSTTTYILTITNSASGCQNTDSVIVTVNTLPTANAGPDQISCNGDSVQIGTTGVAGNSYSWSPATGLDSANVAQPMADPSATTTYTLTVTNTTTGCQNTDQVVVSIGTAPVANAGTDTSICSGDSTQVGSPAVAGNTYSWSPATGLSASNVAQPQASPSVTTTYILTVTSASGCTGSDSVLITVNPLPVADAGTNQTACVGDSVQIGTPAVSGMTYIWAPSAGLSSVFAAQPMAAPTATTTYTVTVSNSSTSCSQTDTVTVTITPGPVADAGADVAICTGDNTTIGTPAVAGMTYSWSPATGLSATNVAQPNASPSTTTTYIVTVNNGSCTDMDTVLVTVNMPPVADAGTGGSVCPGNSINIGTAPVSGNTYSWSPGAGLNSTTDPQPDASPSVTTTYTLTVSNGSCSATDTVTVNVNRPFANAGTDLLSCDGSNVLLGSPAIAGYTYSWSPTTGLSDPYAAQPSAYPGENTTYTLTVTDTASGCMASDEVVFTVGGGGNIFNAISPNGDGNNDWWNVPVFECFSNNKVIIVNRWGNEIWTAENYNNKDVRWNGQNMNGQDVPDGTYYYIISYNGKELHGWVLVKR